MCVSVNIGAKFGKLVVIEIGLIDRGRSSCKVKCDCGKEKILNVNNVTSGRTTSCGCIRKGRKTVIVPTGTIFERLTVIRSGFNAFPNEAQVKGGWSGFALCEVVCVCGSLKIVRQSNLLNGTTKSCGCLSNELASERLKGKFKTHGLKDNPNYDRWRGIMRRCFDPEDAAYFNYGGRGIGVTENWMTLQGFIKDLEVFGLLVEPEICGLRESAYPPDGYSIDRIDNDSDYSLANCRWADRFIQANNQRGRG